MIDRPGIFNRMERIRCSSGDAWPIQGGPSFCGNWGRPNIEQDHWMHSGVRPRGMKLDPIEIPGLPLAEYANGQW